MICPCGCGYEIRETNGKVIIETTRRKNPRRPVAKPAPRG